MSSTPSIGRRPPNDALLKKKAKTLNCELIIGARKNEKSVTVRMTQMGYRRWPTSGSPFLFSSLSLSLCVSVSLLPSEMMSQFQKPSSAPPSSLLSPPNAVPSQDIPK